MGISQGNLLANHLPISRQTASMEYPEGWKKNTKREEKRNQIKTLIDDIIAKYKADGYTGHLFVPTATLREMCGNPCNSVMFGTYLRELGIPKRKTSEFNEYALQLTKLVDEAKPEPKPTKCIRVEQIKPCVKK